MFTRRATISLLATAAVLTTSAGTLLAKQQHHNNGHNLLGANLKKNGKHKIHKARKADVSAEVKNGKVVGLEAIDPQKGPLAVRKVKSNKKRAEAAPSFILVNDTPVQLAQADLWYYGYWFDDGVDEYYYWFPAEYVIVDETWIILA